MTPRTPGYDLHGRLGYRVSHLSRLMQARLEHALSDLGITRLMWCVLTGVGDERVATPSGLADYIGIARPAVSRLLRDMERRALIQRQGQAVDGRAVTLTLTGKGADILAEARPRVNAVHDHFSAKLTPVQRSALMEAIDLLAAGEETPLTRL